MYIYYIHPALGIVDCRFGMEKGVGLLLEGVERE